MKPACAKHSQRGFSLVELLVGLVIGLLGSVVIFQVFAVSEGQKRTTTGGSDAQQNGAFALVSLERDIRQAGYGIATYAPGAPGNQTLFGCNTQLYNTAAAPPAVPAFTLAPLLITNDVGPFNSDVISVFYGSATGLATPERLNVPPVAGDSKLTASTRIGFNINDLVIVVQDAAAPAPDCMIAQVTDLPAGAALEITTAGNQYNFPAGYPLSYPLLPRILNLGPAPVFNAYSVQNGALTVVNRMFGPAGVANPPLVLADSIVNIQAQYGVDTSVPPDDVVDSWQEPTGATWGAPIGASLAQIKAVRIAVVARSGLKEKQEAGACTATTAAALEAWQGGPAVDLSIDPDWQCYRYKRFETIVALPNVIWNF